MKSIIKTEVASVLSDYADGNINLSKIIKGFSAKVFNALDDSDKKAIIELVDNKDFTKAKAKVKIQVNKATGFDNKNTLGEYKRDIAPKYFDETKSITFNRKHFDKDTGVDFRKDTVLISSKMAYELSEQSYKSLKNKSGKYLTDGKDIHAEVKILRGNVKNDVDQCASRFTSSIVNQVGILLGINTVTGTQLPIKVALFGKLDKVNEYYFLNNQTLNDTHHKEWKTWYSAKPSWIKDTK